MIGFRDFFRRKTDAGMVVLAARCFVFGIAALLLPAAALHAGDAGPAFHEETALLAEVPEGSRPVSESVDARPDEGKVAFVHGADDWQKVCMNDTCSARVDRVARGMPVISPDGNYWAAIVRDGDDTRVMLNGQMSGRYDMIYALDFSPDSMKLAYIAQDGEEFFVYVNQDRHESYPLVHPDVGLVFSPDSEDLVYLAQTGDEEWSLIKNGTARAAFEEIKHLTFSPDSSRLAYAAKKDGKWHLAEGADGGDIGPAYDDIAHVAFCPQSENLAYIARKEDGSAMVVNGEEEGEFDEIPGQPMFSRDGERLAYAVAEQRRGDVRMRMVLDGNTGPAFDRIGAYQFSPDGEDFAYMAEKDEKGRIVHNGEEHEAFDSVGIPVFSGQGGRLGYMAAKDRQWHVWADGELGPGFDRVQNPVFSPDGQRMAYLARMDEHYLVIEDDEIVGTYQWAGSLGFSPDGKMVYAAAMDGESFLVVDGEAGEERFLSFLRGVPLVFVEDDVVQAIGFREQGREFHLLRAEIGN